MRSTFAGPACDYLAQVGLSAMLDRVGGPTDFDEDDQESIERASLADSAKVRELLLSREPTEWQNQAGCSWLVPVTWPDRVPGLVTWSGQQSLAKLVKKYQVALAKSGVGDVLDASIPLTGSSGIDPGAAIDSVDAGFSLNAVGLQVQTRIGMELLAIIGLECVPIISFGKRLCGFIHENKVWQFRIERRTGGYYHRWGELFPANMTIGVY